MTEKRNDEYAVRSVCTTPCKYEKHVAKTDLLRAFFPLKLNLTHSVVRQLQCHQNVSYCQLEAKHVTRNSD